VIPGHDRPSTHHTVLGIHTGLLRRVFRGSLLKAMSMEVLARAHIHSGQGILLGIEPGQGGSFPFSRRSNISFFFGA